MNEGINESIKNDAIVEINKKNLKYEYILRTEVDHLAKLILGNISKQKMCSNGEGNININHMNYHFLYGNEDEKQFVKDRIARVLKSVDCHHLVDNIEEFVEFEKVNSDNVTLLTNIFEKGCYDVFGSPSMIEYFTKYLFKVSSELASKGIITINGMGVTKQGFIDYYLNGEVYEGIESIYKSQFEKMIDKLSAENEEFLRFNNRNDKLIGFFTLLNSIGEVWNTIPLSATSNFILPKFIEDSIVDIDSIFLIELNKNDDIEVNLDDKFKYDIFSKNLYIISSSCYTKDGYELVLTKNNITNSKTVIIKEEDVVNHTIYHVDIGNNLHDMKLHFENSLKN